MIDLKEFVFSIVIFVFLVMREIHVSMNKKSKIIELFTDKGFLLQLFIILGFTTYIFYYKKTKITQSAKKALMGLIIAFLASMDLIIATYWIIFIVYYF